jgi:hypothetical protein
MQYICGAPGQTSWFQIETEGEAARESDAMHHAVEKHSSQAHEAAVQTYRSSSSIFIEQDIGLAAHVQRVIRIIIVGLENRDPYPDQEDAIRALGKHLGLTLNHNRCYAYPSLRPSSQ